MCGICGIYGNPDAATATDLVHKMVSVMNHRGPDDCGYYVDNQIALGHARLSIIDLSEAGRQPMTNEDGAIQMCINGEIYNYVELRKELIGRGHRFRSQSDSEVIIHAYEEWGSRCLDWFNGMFGLAIWDSRKRVLVLARDPLGEKPLYCWRDASKEVLIFASEIKAILAAGVKPEVNQDALAGYLALQYSVGRQTLFKGINKVLAGEVMTVSGDQPPKIERYWDIHNSQKKTPERDCSLYLRAELEKSTQLRMRADVPVGAFLSGGIDSAAIVALARPHCKGEFHTFSVGFETFSETPYAEKVSKHLGTTHHNLLIKAEDVARDIRKIAWHYDEPLGDAAIINNYYLGKAAHDQGIKVVLAGEGGDELFAGYMHYKIGMQWHWAYQLPEALRLLPLAAIRSAIPNRGSVDSLCGRLSHLAAFFWQDNFQDAHQYMLAAMGASEIIRYSNISPDQIADFIPHERQDDPLDDMLATDCKNLLPEKFLMKADKAVMASSVEERLPLLDKDVVDLAFSIPSSLKLHKGVEKYVFRQAVRDLLPLDIVYRPKQTFNTPIRMWLRNPDLSRMAVEALMDGELIREYFRTDELKPLIDGLRQGETGGDGGIWGRTEPNVVWTLFALQLWYDTWFGKK